jgi:hypothetical protein
MVYTEIMRDNLFENQEILKCGFLIEWDLRVRSGAVKILGDELVYAVIGIESPIGKPAPFTLLVRSTFFFLETMCPENQVSLTIKADGTDENVPTSTASGRESLEIVIEMPVITFPLPDVDERAGRILFQYPDAFLPGVHLGLQDLPVQFGDPDDVLVGIHTSVHQ